MKLSAPTLTATYEQRQAFIEFLINKRIASTDDDESAFLEWEIAQQVEYRGPEQFAPPSSDPPAAKLLAELKLNKFGQPEGEAAPSDGDDAESVVDDLAEGDAIDSPVPAPWPEEAEEDPGGYGFPL